MSKRVVIAAEQGPGLLERLRDDARFSVQYRPCASEADLVAAAADCQVLVTRHHNRVTGAVLAAAPALELIAQGTSGIDNIDSSAAAARGITILALPGENANAVAELVLGLIIALTRGVPAYSRAVVAGRWERSDCAQHRELRGHRLGIVGLGRVGSRVARLAGGFGMPVLAYDPYLSDQDVKERGASRATALDDVLSQSDILTLHVPLTTETHGMIGRKGLEQLPAGAFLINASRGPVLDQQALFSLVESGHLGGAALDVFEVEPPDPTTLPDDPRIIFTPHIAGCSAESKASIGALLYQRICQHFGFEPAS